MLYIKTESLTYEWHMGTAAPSDLGMFEVIEVQADGDELDYVFHNFPNLPWSRKRVVRWFGDHAKFIAHNL